MVVFSGCIVREKIDFLLSFVARSDQDLMLELFQRSRIDCVSISHKCVR